MSCFTYTLRLLVTTITNRKQPVIFINININCSMSDMWCPWKYWLACQWLPYYAQELKKTSSWRKIWMISKSISSELKYSASLGPPSRETGQVFLLCRAPCPLMLDALRSVHPLKALCTQGVTNRDPPLRCVHAYFPRAFSPVCRWTGCREQNIKLRASQLASVIGGVCK